MSISVEWERGFGTGARREKDGWKTEKHGETRKKTGGWVKCRFRSNGLKRAWHEPGKMSRADVSVEMRVVSCPIA